MRRIIAAQPFSPKLQTSQQLIITFRISKCPGNTLGEYIRKRRSEQGLFQKDLAEMIGLDEMTVLNLEKRRTKPNKQNLEKVEKMLGDLPSF
jgi:DNA-binding XRE family transcriptional regulator